MPQTRQNPGINAADLSYIDLTQDSDTTQKAKVPTGLCIIDLTEESEESDAASTISSIRSHCIDLTAEPTEMSPEISEVAAACVGSTRRFVRLPPEVLAQIFVYTLFDCSVEQVFVDRHALDIPIALWKWTPWMLRSVCSEWRNVAINLCDLWRISIPVSLRWDSREDEYLRKNLRTADAVLPQKGRVSLRFVVSSIARGIWKQAAVWLLDRYAARVKELSIFDMIGCYPDILALPWRDFVALERLELGYEGSYPTVYPLHETDTLREQVKCVAGLNALPRLTTLIIRGMALMDVFLHKDAHLPWKKITHLHLNGLLLTVASSRQLQRVLSHCRHLFSLDIRLGNSAPFPLSHTIGLGPWKTDVHVDDLPHISIPSLRRLAVHDCRQEINFWDLLHLPSLHTLRVRNSENLPWEQLGIAPMLERSSCSLNVLIQESYQQQAKGVAQDFANFLESLPSLVELRTHHAFGGRTLPKIASAKLLPNLKILHCGIKSVSLFRDVLDVRQNTSGKPMKEARGVIFGKYSEGEYRASQASIERKCGQGFTLAREFCI